MKRSSKGNSVSSKATYPSKSATGDIDNHTDINVMSDYIKIQGKEIFFHEDSSTPT
jgi:hypothetical protein